MSLCNVHIVGWKEEHIIRSLSLWYFICQKKYFSSACQAMDKPILNYFSYFPRYSLFVVFLLTDFTNVMYIYTYKVTLSSFLPISRVCRNFVKEARIGGDKPWNSGQHGAQHRDLKSQIQIILLILSWCDKGRTKLCSHGTWLLHI